MTRGSVLVGMSGGVDSSVAACLLAEQGYEVLGSHMELIRSEGGLDHGCCGPTARADAEAVARVGGFPFEVVDLRETFAETVLADFVEEHAAGRTPNPCSRCNEQIKFGAFLRRADDLGIDFVATGHYVRTVRDDAGEWHLLRGLDVSKDQSYMLAGIGQRELARSLFPVGGMPKAETRAHAQRLSLPVADKRDSQEVCFVAGGDHIGFLDSIAPGVSHPGEVVDTTGAVLAHHDGTARFTVGQRRGLGISAPSPTYVLEIDADRNRVVVGPAELLRRSRVVADRARWVAGRVEVGPFEAEVQLRYRGAPVPAVLEAEGEDGLSITLRSPQPGIAPGQSVVVYRGEEVLGGARILSGS